MTLKVKRRKFTVDEYYKMAEAGILAWGDRVELIEGEIVQMAPIGPHHAAGTRRYAHYFQQRFADVALISIQNPVRLSRHNEPQPDVALLRPKADFYASGHPAPEDILLIVEVAETSVRYDRQKALLYARAGVPEYWLFNVRQDAITVFRDPGPEGYRTSFTVRRGDHIAPFAFPDRELAVDDLLGEP